MKKGDKITVLLAAVPKPLFVPGTVRMRVGGRITFDWHDKHAWNDTGTFGGTDTVAYSERGTSWARGWEGKEVEALKVAVALR